jgi:rubredoxin
VTPNLFDQATIEIAGGMLSNPHTTMFDNYSDGYCPQCALDDKQVEMSLNRGDYWECPECHLQAAGGSASFMILRKRGEGKFQEPRVGATAHISGAFLTRQSADEPFDSDGWFEDEAELRDFLEKQVRTG